MKHGTIKAGSVPFCFSMGELLDEETCAKYNIQLVPLDRTCKLEKEVFEIGTNF